MAGAAIDRLTLRVPGLPEGDARRLAGLVGEGLAAQPSLDESQATHAPNVSIRVRARPGMAVTDLAALIVAEIVAELRRGA